MDTDNYDAQMMEALSTLDEQAQEHFRSIVRMLALCYTAPQLYSGVLITSNEDETVMMSLNADEMEAADLIAKASTFITRVVTQDAPPRDQFN